MRQRGVPLAELADCMDEYPQETRNLPVRSKPPIDEVPALAEAIAAVDAGLGGSGRTLVRYSGTERKIRLLVECPDAAQARRHIEFLAQAVMESIGA